MSLENQMRLGAEWRARTGFASQSPETTAEWYARQAAKPPHPGSTALFLTPEENARTVAAFLRQRAAPGHDAA